MLREALEFLTSQAQRAQTPQTFPEPNGPSDSYYLVENGQAVRCKALPKTLEARLRDPEQVAAYIRNSPLAVAPLVLIGVWKLTAYLDHERRTDCVSCDMPVSEAFAFLRDFRGRKMSQVDTLRALRVTFAGAVDRGVIYAIKNLTFETAAKSESVIDHGKEAISRTVKAKVSGLLEIPDQFTVEARVYDFDCLAPARITCALELSTKDSTIAFTALPGQLTAAQVEAQRQIAKLFAQIDGAQTYLAE